MHARRWLTALIMLPLLLLALFKGGHALFVLLLLVHMTFLVPVPADVPAPRAVPELHVRTADGRSFTFHNIVDDIPHRIPTGAVSLIYNAKFSVLQVYVRLPREVFVPRMASTELTFRGVLHFGATTIRSYPVAIKLSSTASRNQISPILPEPTTDLLCSPFHHYKIIERSRTGVGFAILDVTPAAH